jgi:FkbM family methyltransferase
MTLMGIDLVIDVGANRGQFGLEIRRAGYRGSIVSIEPLAAPHRQLSQLADKDGRWTAIRSAVGPQAGSAAIHVAANGGASSSFLPMLELHAHEAPAAQYVADELVDVATLDDIALPHLQHGAATFTKIDVQGYELQVLAGGPTTVARSSLVQIEMSLSPLYEGAPTYRDILEAMGQRGFQLVGIEPGFAAHTGLLLQADGLFATDRAAGSLRGHRE